MSKKKDVTKLSFSAHGVAIVLGLLGIVLIVVSVIWDTQTAGKLATVIDKLVSIFGEILIGSVAVSLLLEISTLKQETSRSVKEGCTQVLDTVFGDDPKYLLAISPEKNERSRMQLIAAALKQQNECNLFSTQFVEQSALRKFENRIMDSLLEGIICNGQERIIQITPVLGPEHTTYKIHVRETYELQFLSPNAISALRNHRFRFISKKQADSFKLCSLIVDGTTYNNLSDYITETDNVQSFNDVGNRTFNYLVSVSIPKPVQSLESMRYRIEYQYENYEMGTYLTCALNYLTYNVSEEYSIHGDHKDDYIIHGFEHFPYHSDPNRKIHFNQVTPTAICLKINEDWQLPGAGCSVVVREKNKSQIY